MSYTSSKLSTLIKNPLFLNSTHHLPFRLLSGAFIKGGRGGERERGVTRWHSSPFFLLCFSILNFKTLFLWLEVGIRFKALNNRSNTKCCFVEIHQWWKLWLIHIIKWKSVQYVACGLEITLSTRERHIAHSRIIVESWWDLNSEGLESTRET